MNKAEQELLDYLTLQYPATYGHIPLKKMIHDVWKSGMTNAIDIIDHYETGGHVGNDIFTKQNLISEIRLECK